MKALIAIPLLTAAPLAVVAIILAVAGVHVRTADPISAGIIAATAGMIGIAPMIAVRPRDQVTAFQLALVGTVLHMMSALAIGVSLIACHALAMDGQLGYWLVGGYWASLLATVGQLRRLVLSGPLAKAEK